MSKEDWQYCYDVIAFMKPLYLLVKGLEGKPESGANGFVADVIPWFDYMEEHLQLQLESFALQNQPSIKEDGAPVEYSMGYINTLNAQLKLQKYKANNTSVVLFAACVLVPWLKWDYFEEHLTEQEMRDARRLVQDIWDTKYAIITVTESVVVEEVWGGTASTAADVSKRAPLPPNPTNET